jgi:hypothetical protein
MSDSDGEPRPILPGAVPAPQEFQPRGGGRANTRRPSRERQGQRLDARFSEIERLIAGRAEALVTTGIPDADPELVVVLEVLDSTTDLNGALRQAGLEPLIEAEDEIADGLLGDDFARVRPVTPTTNPVKRFFHTSMANERAVAQLLALWRHWKSGQRLPNGFGPFREVFAKLLDVRAWGPADRVRSTGLAELLQEALGAGWGEVPVHIELWFRENAQQRHVAEQEVRRLVEAAQGSVLLSAIRQEIGYHALAVSLPRPHLDQIARGPELAELSAIALLQTPEVLYVRPGGQSVGTTLEDGLPPDAVDPTLPSVGQPLLAVLDGLPASNHPRLAGRLEVFDPDDIASDPTYTTERRRHGTMVASAAVWGDLAAGLAPADRRVLVRPVLKPDLQTAGAVETVPWNVLPADLTMRAVREVLAAAPTVRIFNLSLGDPLAQFDTIPTAWARAIDWLSHEHGVLFVVSAGNHLGPLPIAESDLQAAFGEDRDRLTAAALASLATQRRLLSPAESINSLTIGALHEDSAGDSFPMGYRVDPWDSPGRPSPISAHGRGIRRSVKPDLAVAGGRQLYSARFGSSQPMVEVARATAVPPGVAVAAPPDLQAHATGTTFAAVEVSRRAVAIADSLDPTQVDDAHVAVATKALLMHGTTFTADQLLILPTDRLLGYGPLGRDLASGCLPSQATVLFTGDLRDREEVDLVMPFPQSVAGLSALRRITMTLAWFSPVNWNHRQYRRAKLVVEGPSEIPGPTRSAHGINHQLAQRGTVHHRVIETTRAYPAAHLTFPVKCSGQAGGLTGSVPFALAVTLEVGPGNAVDVYDAVRQEIRARTRIR